MTDFENVPDVLTMEDLQKVLRIGRSTAYRLVKANDIPCVRIGRSIRIPKRFVVEYIQASVEDRRNVRYDGDNVTTQDRGLP
ncbi:MAG: helix-turn-helix domain-containing protein [Ruminococcus flavefaciens]|nr:helix-turn-helix domain-containing protein [Ruminococcus flavefaciens]